MPGDESKTREQLLEELEAARRRVAELEASGARESDEGAQRQSKEEFPGRYDEKHEGIL